MADCEHLDLDFRGTCERKGCGFNVYDRLAELEATVAKKDDEFDALLRIHDRTKVELAGVYAALDSKDT